MALSPSRAPSGCLLGVMHIAPSRALGRSAAFATATIEAERTSVRPSVLTRFCGRAFARPSKPLFPCFFAKGVARLSGEITLLSLSRKAHDKMERRLTINGSGTKLRDWLLARGVNLPWRCGGNGRCGSCRIEVISGDWLAAGKPVTVPSEQLACTLTLTSHEGIIVLPAPPPEQDVLTVWRTSPLPDNPCPVLAVDLGTTTVVAARVEHGQVSATATSPNLQRDYGDNVLSRVEYCRRPDGLAMLQRAALESIRRCLEQLPKAQDAQLAVAGNTVMTCLLHGVSPLSIGEYPFTAPQLLFPERRDLLPDSPPMLTMPCVSAYLGGDVLAGLSEVKLQPGNMLLDLGTNCEIVIRTDRGDYCGTSAPAGPAFEGVGLSCGGWAGKGCVTHYGRNGLLKVSDGSSPRCLCGSALVDFLAVERESGGLSRLGRYEDGSERRELAPGVSVTEQDIALLLQAKAAVATAISALERHCDCQAKRIFLAGAFASNLNLASAFRAGLLPEGREYIVCGNTSLAGAARLASSPQSLTELESLSLLPREFPLNDLPGFAQEYCRNLALP